jgi:m7GpppX diphosphatase
MHFVALQYDAPGTHTEKAHMLTTVISNLEIMPDYYSKVNLPFVVRETEPLFNKLEEHGR